MDGSQRTSRHVRAKGSFCPQCAGPHRFPGARLKFAGDCAECGTYRKSLHRDHRVPLWNGGADDESNISWICANCHEDKTSAEMQTPEWKAYCRRKSDERRALIH